MSLEEIGEEVIVWFNDVWRKVDSGFEPGIHHAYQAVAYMNQIKFGDADPEKHGGDRLHGIFNLVEFGVNTIIPMSSRTDEFTEKKQTLVLILEKIKTDQREPINRAITLLKN